MTESERTFAKEAPIVTPFFEIPVLGNFGQDEILMDDTKEVLTLPDDIAKIIDENWELRKKEVEARGGRLTDNPKVLFKGYRVEGEKLYLHLGRTNYKGFVGTYGEEFRRDHPEFITRLLSAGAVVETSDNYWMINHRQKVFQYPGWLDMFGGAVELSHVDEKGEIDPFRTVADELHEEAKLEEADIESMKCLGLMKDPVTGIEELMFWTKTRLAKEEIEELQKGENLEEGPSVFIPIKPGEVGVKILWFAKIFVSDGAAALTLLGRERFGEEWFQLILYRLSHLGKRYTDWSEEQRKTLEDRLIARLGTAN